MNNKSNHFIFIRTNEYFKNET